METGQASGIKPKQTRGEAESERVSQTFLLKKVKILQPRSQLKKLKALLQCVWFVGSASQLKEHD